MLPSGKTTADPEKASHTGKEIGAEHEASFLNAKRRW